MAQKTDIRLNDYGWTLRLTVKEEGAVVDLSNLTLANALRIVPPSGATRQRTMAYTTTGVDGKVEYVVADGDFDRVGRWTCFVQVDTGTLEKTAGPFYVDVAYI